MKKLISILILLVFAQFIAAAEIPPWHVIKASERGTKLIKIVEALYEYESKVGKFPSTLYGLVAKGILKEEDLCLSNSDKSISVPDYFPTLTTKSRPDSGVIKTLSEDRSYEIIVRMDMSISGVDIKKKAEQAAP
jgi:hypothetical protein